MSAYREMDDVLGADERESEATRALGRWRDRVRTGFLAGFAVLGVAPAAIGYWVVQEAQFRANHGVASVRINVLGVVVPWLACMFLGKWIGSRVVARRMPAQVIRLATAYEIPHERLGETARLLAGL